LKEYQFCARAVLILSSAFSTLPLGASPREGVKRILSLLLLIQQYDATVQQSKSLLHTIIIIAI
jgi:hypothetical protein